MLIFFNFIIFLFFSLNIFFSKNVVYSLLSLICCFIFASSLLLQFGIDYIPLLYINIYVGALAVLFLFVIMMLNIRVYSAKNVKLFYILFIILSILYLFVYYSFVSLENDDFYMGLIFFIKPIRYSKTALKTIGGLLFGTYFLYVLLASLILFVSMVGSVVLVFEFDKKKKTQNMPIQAARKRKVVFFNIK